MSNILSGAQQSAGNTLMDAREEAFKVSDALKAKKEETAKTIEEGLGGLKVMLGGKGVTKAIFDDPVVKKFGAQLKDRAGDAIKKAGQDLLDRIPKPLEFSGEEAPAGAAPSTSFSNPLFSPADADAADAADLAAKQEQLDSLVSKGAQRLQDGEDVFREGYDGVEDGLEHVTSGDGTLFRAGERASDDILDTEYENVADNAGIAKALPEDNLADGEFGTAETGGMTAAEADQAAGLTADIASKAPAATTTASGANVSTAAGAEIEGGTEGAEAGAAGAGAAAGGAAAGEDAAIGGSEAVLAGLDAIPFLDIFTLAAGAGLAGAAAAKKRVAPTFTPNIDAMQSGAAFQAGFNQI